MDETLQELWRAPVRRRLVRLCAAISGDPAAAEDLAQETLLEAWRNAHKLRDPSGAERWLAAIARNVCLRSARRRGRRPLLLRDAVAGDEVDLDAGLERAELLELLDRALALLPPETRDAFVQRYVDDAPHGEIAARLGISQDAVSMRLARGKSVLRRILAAELGHEADVEWRETRVWCGQCGLRKLAMRDRRVNDAVTFSCPDCSPGVPGSDFPLGNPHFAELVGGLVRPSAILARTGDWLQRYFGGGAGASDVCTRCGRAVMVARYRRAESRNRDGLYVACDGCGEQVSSSVEGLALARAEVRRFRREHPRTRLLPRRDLDFGGVPSFAVRVEDVLGRSAVDVVFAGETLRVLAVAR
ncbi:MAG: RNA polymerase sigma factor [Gaiellaceae bacterium]|jgi:RNA polymerase sigma factor (sigma-70 family)